MALIKQLICTKVDGARGAQASPLSAYIHFNIITACLHV